MAGLGRRTFAAGEVLTAGNVMGYLQDQAVMNFAGTAARGSAIGSAVSEGMVSYLADTNAVEVYDGSAWNSLPNGIVRTTSGGTNSLGYKELAANFSTSSTSYVDVTGMSISFTATAGRLYRATYSAYLETSNTSQRFRLSLTDGSNNEKRTHNDQTNTLWSRLDFTESFIFTGSGSTTLKLRVQTIDTGSLYFYGISGAGAFPAGAMRLWIEDIGAA